MGVHDGGPDRPAVTAAAAGAACISTSAVVMRLAGSSARSCSCPSRRGPCSASARIAAC